MNQFWITWEYMDMLMSIHVLGQVTCQFLEKPDLGSQLKVHLGGKTYLEVIT